MSQPAFSTDIDWLLTVSAEPSGHAEPYTEEGKKKKIPSGAQGDIVQDDEQVLQHYCISSGLGRFKSRKELSCCRSSCLWHPLSLAELLCTFIMSKRRKILLNR